MELIIGLLICIVAISVSYLIGEYFDRGRWVTPEGQFTLSLDEEHAMSDEDIEEYIRFAVSFMRRRQRVYPNNEDYYRKAAEEMVLYRVEYMGCLPSAALAARVAQATQGYFTQGEQSAETMQVQAMEG